MTVQYNTVQYSTVPVISGGTCNGSQTDTQEDSVQCTVYSTTVQYNCTVQLYSKTVQYDCTGQLYSTTVQCSGGTCNSLTCIVHEVLSGQLLMLDWDIFAWSYIGPVLSPWGPP